MPRILWLAYERLPHPDAVSYPAGEDDVRLVLELLARPYPDRQQISEQLRHFQSEQDALPMFCRRSIPCRRESGLYHLIPWRLAKWLSAVLRAEDRVIERTQTRIHNWLEGSDHPQVISPTRPAK